MQSLEPALAASPPLLRICGKAFPELKNEALTFPVAAHDDLLDALAGAFAKAGRSRLYDFSGSSRSNYRSEIDRMCDAYAVNPPSDWFAEEPGRDPDW